MPRTALVAAVNELESEGWRAVSSASPASDLSVKHRHYRSAALLLLCLLERASGDVLQHALAGDIRTIRQRECAAAGRTVVGSCLLFDPSSPPQAERLRLFSPTPLLRRSRGLRAPPRSRRRRRRRDGELLTCTLIIFVATVHNTFAHSSYAVDYRTITH